MSKSYYEKLKDPRWQKKRLEIMQRDEFVCQHCSCDSNTLNVHHKEYKKNTDPWDYPDSDLITLCESCHEGVSRLIKFFSRSCSDDLNHYFLCLVKRILEESGDFKEVMYFLDTRPELIPIIKNLLESLHNREVNLIEIIQNENLPPTPTNTPTVLQANRP